MNDDHADLQRRRFLRDSARWSFAAAAASLLPNALAQPGLHADQQVLARVRGGRVRGQREHGTCVFRGLRYGADTAAYRFQPPRRETPWRGIADALDYGAAAPDRKSVV